MVARLGYIGVDGAGTLVTTQQCLLHPNRNPSHSRVEIEDQMRSALGVETIVWLPWGLSLDDDTDGHVDNVAAFAEPGRLLMQACDDPSEADHERLRINARWAKGAVDADGRPIAVVEVPVLPFVDVDAERICVPYLNLYVCNGAVIVPVTGHHADTEMLALIGSEFPGRTVLPVPGLTLAIGGGGPHCITQQVPVS